MRALYAGLRKMQAVGGAVGVARRWRTRPLVRAGARGYGPPAIGSGSPMKRRVALVLTLFTLSLALSACDKCGGFQEIRVPGQPNACRDDAAR